MGKKLYIVLGNGFSIDFLHHIEMNDEIDVVNLFSKGAEVPWPGDGSPGFLSFKNCPNLWNLGARPNMSQQDSWDLLEDVITCINVFASKDSTPPIGELDAPNSIYIRAYKELLGYLRHLFIYYDQKSIGMQYDISQWAWLLFLKHHASSDEFEEVSIVTYNYDIWLERVLQKEGIPFNIA